MRRSFAFVVLPLAIFALVPVLLIQRAGPHDRATAPWGVDQERLQALRETAAERGLAPATVFVAETGAGDVGTAPILLEGKTSGGRTCAVVVRGPAAGPLHCFAAIFRRRPVWALTYHPPGVPGLAVLGILRRDVQRLVLVPATGRATGLDILEPGHVFNVGVPGSSVRLRLFGRGGRVLGDVRLRG